MGRFTWSVGIPQMTGLNGGSHCPTASDGLASETIVPTDRLPGATA